MAGSLWLADRAMPRQVVFARETAGDYRFYYLKDGGLHSVVKGDSEIWHYRRTGGKAPPFFGSRSLRQIEEEMEEKQAEKRKAELDEKKKQARKQRKTEADEKKKQANKSKENARHHRLKRAVSDETEKQARKQRYSCSWAREEC